MTAVTYGVVYMVLIYTIEVRHSVENEDVVGAAPTAPTGAAPVGAAPATSEWSTILLPTKVPVKLEVWRQVTTWIAYCFGTLLTLYIGWVAFRHPQYLIAILTYHVNYSPIPSRFTVPINRNTFIFTSKFYAPLIFSFLHISHMHNIYYFSRNRALKILNIFSQNLLMGLSQYITLCFIPFKEYYTWNNRRYLKAISQWQRGFQTTPALIWTKKACDTAISPQRPSPEPCQHTQRAIGPNYPLMKNSLRDDWCCKPFPWFSRITLLAWRFEAIWSGLRYWLGYSHETWIFRISRSFPAAISVIPRGTLRCWRNAQYP